MDNFIYPFLFNGPCFHSKTPKASHKSQRDGSSNNGKEKPEPKFHPRKLRVECFKNEMNVFNIEMLVNSLKTIDCNINAISEKE